jgi:RimJ/RimL family protein N-acetyltransferase
MEPGDLDFVAAMLADQDVMLYYPHTYSREQAQGWLDRQRQRYADDGHGLWLVLDRATDTPVGQVGLLTQEVEGARHPEVGWLLHRPYWGKGYATEAGIAVRDAAFGRWRYPALISLIRPVNEPSWRVAERVGFTPGPLVQFHGFEHVMYQAAAP